MQQTYKTTHVFPSVFLQKKLAFMRSAASSNEGSDLQFGSELNAKGGINPALVGCS